MKRLLIAATLFVASISQAATITDVRFSGAGPVTFGQVFAVGDMKKTDVLVGSLAGVAVPLQVDIKATHADGSVRHAIISANVPKAGTMQINTGGFPAKPLTGLRAALPVVTATATIAGVKCAATASEPSKVTWLSGPIVNEYQTVAPLSCAGVPHPHLTVRFAVRQYASKSRVDVTIENAWAYEPGPQNFTYDTDISIDGKSVYSKAGLTHYHHARWRKVFWDGPVVQANTKYLIASKAVPNYDQSFSPSEKSLNDMAITSVDPMSIGLAASYMPMTGAHNDIGIMPLWSAAYVLSMDRRARDATLFTGDGAGAWSMHFRDRKTDRPVSLSNFPYMTQYGNYGDTWNPTNNKMEAFPACAGDCSTPYTHDVSHQPSLAYLPYLMTGDYFYLEEMQFWAMFDVFASNPNYRGFAKGWVQSEQLRGQAWALRTLAQAAAFTPDADPLKPDLVGFMNNNLDWYNTTYTNNAAANKLGAIVNGYAFSYQDETAIAPWQDDFFTSAIGHAAELGFDKAVPLLAWKSKFSIGRMVAQGVCWVDAAVYNLKLRDTNATNTLYTTFEQAQRATRGDAFMKLPCGGMEMAGIIGAKQVNDMGQISDGFTGFPSNMQPALAYAVDAGVEGGKPAWDKFMSRTVKPDYTDGLQFAIIPRSYVAPMTAAEVEAAQWRQIAKEGETVTVPSGTRVRYGGAGKFFEKTVSGVVTASNDFFGGDPAPNVVKTLQKFVAVDGGATVEPPTPSSPIPVAIPTKVTTSTNTKLVKQNPLTVVFIDSSKLTPVKTFTGVVATSKGAFTVIDALLIPGSTYLVIVANSASKPLDAFLLTVPK